MARIVNARFARDTPRYTPARTHHNFRIRNASLTGHTVARVVKLPRARPLLASSLSNPRDSWSPIARRDTSADVNTGSCPVRARSGRDAVRVVVPLGIRRTGPRRVRADGPAHCYAAADGVR